MRQKSPITIAGAGPAGLTAAIALAKHGLEVHVHEKYEVAGKRFQGDLQGLENWTEDSDVLEQLQSYGIEINFEASPFHQFTLTNGRHEFSRKSKQPLFYLVKRGALSGSLDSGLAAQAVKNNVKIYYSSHFPLDAADIIATGPIRQAVVAMDKGVVFKTDLPNMAVGIFNDEFAYKGYSYLLITEGYGCLCAVVFKDLNRLNTCFEQTVAFAKKKYGLNLENASPVGGLGSFCLNHEAQLGKASLVGESAGLQDMLWGFGIRTAIKSGVLAAQAYLQEQDYPVVYSAEFQKYMKAGVVNRYLWEKVKAFSTPLIPYFLLFPLPARMNFKLLYSYTLLHRMLYPLACKYIQNQYPLSIQT